MISLETKDLSINYGEKSALRDVNIKIKKVK